ncbi:MAG: methyltransferase domain-containing protein [Lewinellaceae bacterium]|nr:methyltransferase domain-containing protein [Phaeodactylibacter sp.]MCB9039062.1 methyltransferase domain-containing protein [Lewinellaceae bacterium]
MKEFWDQRYGEAAYVYGKAPNAFLKEQLAALPPARALFPAEGEGRNAVYAATLGWQVTAFDYSEAGRRKAEALAREFGVRIDYQIAEVEGFPFPESTFDLVGLFFVHLPPASRQLLHRQAAQCLRPGGRIILEAFSKQQLGLSSGGPKRDDMLFSVREIKKDFPSLQLQLLEETETILSEGPYHNGPAWVIRLLGARK